MHIILVRKRKELNLLLKRRQYYYLKRQAKSLVVQIVKKYKQYSKKLILVKRLNKRNNLVKTLDIRNPRNSRLGKL